MDSSKRVSRAHLVQYAAALDGRGTDTVVERTGWLIAHGMAYVTARLKRMSRDIWKMHQMLNRCLEIFLESQSAKNALAVRRSTSTHTNPSSV